MTVRGTTSLAVSPAAAMSVLRAPERLAAALPNVDDFVLERDGRFTATIRPALALGEVPIRTIWRPADADAEEVRYLMEGRTDEQEMRLDARLRLVAKGTSTEAAWSIELMVTGALRTVGQRALDAVIAAQTARVLDAVAREAVRDGGAG